MSQIILDFGSGNSCRNDTKYIKRMYDELKAVDTGKHSIVCKWQLFEKAGENKPLLPECFECAYEYGTKLGYKVTSSVFDKNSLDFLLRFDIPFVKIANNRNLDWLIEEVPRRIPVYVSVGPGQIDNERDDGLAVISYMNADKILCCVSKYPAYDSNYRLFAGIRLRRGISDHTIDFNLWNQFRPEIVEWHYKLSDSTGLDAGPFARTPEALVEVL
jgi:sialic acid synthase SpsE